MQNNTQSKNWFVAFLLLVVVAALYRLIPGRMGFAPQYSMCLFSAAVFKKSKVWAFVFPILSMVLSDLGLQLMFKAGMSTYPGFYSGIWISYLIWAFMVLLSFGMKKLSVQNVFLWSLIIPTAFFLVSNFSVWLTSAMYPNTFSGLMNCYAAGLPFYPKSLLSGLVFSAILFGAYIWQGKKESSHLFAI